MNAGDNGNQRQHRLDALTGKQGRAGGGPAEAHGPAMDAPKRFARAGEVGFPGSLGVEPCTLYPLDGAVISGNGGDQCREAVDTIVAVMDEIGMKSQGREAAVADGTSMQVGLRMGAIDRPATPPKAACRFFMVVAAGVIAAIGGSGWRQ